MDYQNLIIPIKGKAVKAIYRENTIPTYVGNPLIDALPDILSADAAIDELAYYPPYNDSLRTLPNETRYHLLENIVRFFTPLNVHIDLERRISRVIRTGYIERNPMKNKFWRDNAKRADAVNESSYSQYGKDDDFHSTSAYGFNMVGISGIGKSLAVERILRLYPQVIHHTKYHERTFNYSQIVWLKLDCPFDGSLKGLCINFFQTVDSLLGTSYHKNYGGKTRTTDEMLPYMALVAANHGIGVLVIDEIQRLSLSKSGGTEKMLNFFVQIVNTVGVPVILVGTYKSLSIFDGNFSQTRRGTGQGDLVWDRMKYDEEWELFVNALWEYQYTKKVCSLEPNPEIFEVLYDETQGITDLAVKVYMLAQERAIETGTEIVTASIIRSVAKDRFRMLQPALAALRSKTKNALVRFEDAYPQFLIEYVKNSSKSSGEEVNQLPRIEGEIASAPEIRSAIAKYNKTKSPKSLVSSNGAELNDEKHSSSEKINASPKNRKILEKSAQEQEKYILPQILASIENPDSKSIHGALHEAGFIRSGNEFII